MNNELKKINVLIVDDEKEFRKVLSSELMSINSQLHCLEAEDVSSAANIIDTQNIHVILCDLKLPNEDGLSFLEKLRSNKNYIPFIFITGFADKDMAIKALQLGAFDIIEKPASIDTIHKSLLTAINYIENFYKLKETYKNETSIVNESLLKLKSINYPFKSYDQINSDPSLINKYKLAAFTSEAIPQLLHAMVSLNVLKNLKSNEEKVIEIIFLISLMQAIRDNALWIRDKDLINTSNIILNALTKLRMDIQLLNNKVLDILIRGIKYLHAYICCVGLEGVVININSKEIFTELSQI